MPAVSHIGIQAPEESPFTRSVNRLIDGIENCRLMVASCADLCQDINCFEIYASASASPSAHLSRRERAVMRLYERLAPLDYAAGSLKMADNCGEIRTAGANREDLQRELALVAADILTTHEALQAESRACRERIEQPASRNPGEAFLAETHWDDPIREKQRSQGVNIGWQLDFSVHSDLTIARLLVKARKTGVTFITPGHALLSWEQAEKRPGVYDFSSLERALAAVHEAGLSLRLPLSLVRGGVPRWFREQHPESVLNWTGGTSSAHAESGDDWHPPDPVNLFDPATRKAFKKMLIAVERFCREKGYSDTLLTLSLEVPGDAVAWRHVKNGSNPRYVGSYYELAASIVREVFPAVLTDLQIMEYLESGRGADSAPLHAIDLLRNIDIATSRGDGPLIRALTAEANHSSSVVRTGAPAAGAAYDLATSSLAYGFPDSTSLAGCMLTGRIWRENTAGADAVLSPEIPGAAPNGIRSVRWDTAFSSFLTTRRIHGISPYLLNTKMNAPGIALFMPPLGSQPDACRPLAEAAGWAWALEILGIPFETWGESALNGGLPARIKTLILPQAVQLTNAHVKIIRAFAREGGTVICVFAPGSAYGAYPLATVAGCQPQLSNGRFAGVGQPGVKGTWLQTSMPYANWKEGEKVPPPDSGYPRHWQARRGQAVGGQSLQLKPGSSVLANFISGEPALVAFTRFKGNVYTLAYPFGVELGIAAGPMMRSGFVSSDLRRNVQVVGMLEWLRGFLKAIGIEAPVRVSRWQYLYGPGDQPGADLALAYPKEALRKNPLATREGTTDHALRFSWFSAPDNDIQYLGVVNMTAAGTTGRGAVYSRLLPRYYRISLRAPLPAAITDVCRQVPVAFTEDGDGVHFWTALAPGDFTIFALSASPNPKHYPTGAFPGVSQAHLSRQLELLARRAPEEVPAVIFSDPAAIGEWFAAHAERDLFISCPPPHFQGAGEDLARAIRESYGNQALTTEADGEPVHLAHGGSRFRPPFAQILLGNEWTNNAVANFGRSAGALKHEEPVLLKNAFSATPEWPGPGRAVVALTRRRYMSAGAAIRDSELDRAFNHHQRLLILASDTAGVQSAVQAIRDFSWQLPDMQEYDSSILLHPRVRKQIATWKRTEKDGGVPAEALPEWLPKIDRLNLSRILDEGISNRAEAPRMSYRLSETSPGHLPGTTPQPVILVYHRLEGHINVITAAKTGLPEDHDMPRKCVLKISRRIPSRGVFAYSPFTDEADLARIVSRTGNSTTVVVEITSRPLLLLFSSDDS